MFRCNDVVDGRVRHEPVDVFSQALFSGLGEAPYVVRSLSNMSEDDVC